MWTPYLTSHSFPYKSNTKIIQNNGKLKNLVVYSIFLFSLNILIKYKIK